MLESESQNLFLHPKFYSAASVANCILILLCFNYIKNLHFVFYLLSMPNVFFKFNSNISIWNFKV